MVFLTEVCFKYMPYWLRRSPKTSHQSSKYFRHQAVLRLTGLYYGKNRNCYKVAINKLTKRMQYGIRERQERRVLISDTYKQRVLAAVEEHHFKFEYFHSALQKCGIELNIKSLANLATYEPRTFKCLVDVAKAKFNEDDSELSKCVVVPEGVITRGML